jgi:hypothetical protein
MRVFTSVCVRVWVRTAVIYRNVSVEWIVWYSGGLGFKSCAVDHLSWLRNSLQTSSRIRPLPFAFFPVHFLPLIAYFDAIHIKYEALNASLNKSLYCNEEPRSMYSNWLRGGRPRGRSSSSGRVKNFFFSTSSRPALGLTQPPIQWVPGALSPGVKRQGREADHSSLTSAEVKKIWIYTSTPPYAFSAQCLIS